MNIADLFATLRITPNTKSFDAADRLIDGVKSALVGLAALAGAHVLAGMVQDTVELGSHINDLSASTGVATDTLQELGYIAKLNSSNMDDVGHALGKLGNNMKAAADGGKTQIEAFSKLGVKITDTTGKLRPTEDVFEDISINQRKLTNETEKGAAIFGVLGKSGRSLIPTMNDIADKGMAPLAQEARDLGAVMDSEAIAALDEFGDTQDKVKMGLQGLRNQAVIALLPTLQNLADSFLEWVKANKEMIKLKLQVVLNILIKALQGVATAANIVLKIFSFMQDHWDAIKVGIMGLAAAMVIFQTKSIAAAVASGAAWLVANLPLVFLAAIMTGIILLIDDLITAFQGGDSVIKEWFQSRGYDWDTFSEKVQLVAGAMKAAFEAVFKFLQDKFGWLIDTVSKAIDLWNSDPDAELAHLQAINDNIDKTIAESKAAIAAMDARRDPKKEAKMDAIMTEARGHLDPEERARYDAKYGVPSVGAGSPTGSSVVIQAPVTVHVDGSKDPALTAAAVRSVVEDHFQQQIVQASSGIGGVR